MPWRQRILLAVLLLLAILAIVWAFLPRPVPVETAAVSRGPLRVTVEEEGKTRLRDRFVVSAPVAGYARRVGLEVGDPVTRGQALATLEPLRAEALDPRARAVAEARVATAEAALRASEERVRETAAVEEYAAARLDRTRKLAEAGLTPRDTLEQVESEAKRARAEKGSAVEAADAARHELEAAKAALTEAGEPGGKDRGKVVVRSPVRGRGPDPPRHPGALRALGGRRPSGRQGPGRGARRVHEDIRARGGGAAGPRDRGFHVAPRTVEEDRRRLPAGGDLHPLGGEGRAAGPGRGGLPDRGPVRRLRGGERPREGPAGGGRETERARRPGAVGTRGRGDGRPSPGRHRVGWPEGAPPLIPVCGFTPRPASRGTLSGRVRRRPC